MLKQTCSNCQILTEKPLITLLHTTMFFILFIYYDCTRNLWFALKTWDNVKVLFSFSGSWQVMTTVFLFLLSLKGPSIRPFMRGIHGMSCALDSTPWIPSARYSVLDSGLQFFSGIPDSKAQDFRFHKHTFPWFRNPQEKKLPDSRTWGDLMFMEILKCLRAEQGPR